MVDHQGFEPWTP